MFLNLFKKKKYTVDNNAFKHRKKYPLSSKGYFGEKGKNKRVIYAKNQYSFAKKFFNLLTFGGKKKTLTNGRGIQKIMGDNGIVTYRKKTTTPNSPAVDFSRMQGKVKNQRVHFLKRR